MPVADDPCQNLCSQNLHNPWYKNLRLVTAGRFEWFRDDDGARVQFFDFLSDNEGHYYQTALGLNYAPGANLTIRSEGRWDWSDGRLPPGSGTGLPITLHPYDDLTDGSQFTWATDLIVQF
jgi:Putative beta-barrel porin-2, OmpL-like. bbp2